VTVTTGVDINVPTEMDEISASTATWCIISDLVTIPRILFISGEVTTTDPISSSANTLAIVLAVVSLVVVCTSCVITLDMVCSIMAVVQYRDG